MSNAPKFSDLKFRKTGTALNGKAARHTFPNGYGASVVCHDYSYGGKSGLFELAVLGLDGRINSDTRVTDDVLGFLSPQGVTKAMRQIADLNGNT